MDTITNNDTNNGMPGKLFEKGNTLGNRFSSTNQPKKNGRKPKLYKQLKGLIGKAVGYELEQEDYYNIIRFLMEQDLETLDGFIKTKNDKGQAVLNPKVPIWVLNIVTAINTDVRYGRTSTVEMLFDRVFGKAVQPVQGDIVTNGRKQTDTMSDEELEAEIARLDEILKH